MTSNTSFQPSSNPSNPTSNPSCLQGFFWEINWQYYGNSPVGNSLLFSCCFQDSLFIFNIWHLIMMCLGVVLFGSNLFGTLCASWTCMSISFTKLGKFSFIIFSSKFSISCSSSSSGTFMIKILVSWRCLRGFLFYPYFFFNSLFFFLFLLNAFCLPYVPNHCFEYQCHPLYCWFPVDFSLFHLM